MGRPPRFSVEGILDAALVAVSEHGRDATVAQVAGILETRTASIYYRFPSRQLLMASLWLRGIRRFHTVFLAPLTRSGDPVDALVEAAVTIPDYCRAHPDEAVGLTLYRQSKLLQSCPPELYEDVASVNTQVLAVIEQAVTAAWPGGRPMPVVLTAVQQLPYGLVRPYIGTPERVPAWVSDAVRAASRAVLELVPEA